MKTGSKHTENMRVLLLAALCGIGLGDTEKAQHELADDCHCMEEWNQHGYYGDSDACHAIANPPGEDAATCAALTSDGEDECVKNALCEWHGGHLCFGQTTCPDADDQGTWCDGHSKAWCPVKNPLECTDDRHKVWGYCDADQDNELPAGCTCATDWKDYACDPGCKIGVAEPTWQQDLPAEGDCTATGAVNKEQGACEAQNVANDMTCDAQGAPQPASCSVETCGDGDNEVCGDDAACVAGGPACVESGEDPCKGTWTPVGTNQCKGVWSETKEAESVAWTEEACNTATGETILWADRSVDGCPSTPCDFFFNGERDNWCHIERSEDCPLWSNDYHSEKGGGYFEGCSNPPTNENAGPGEEATTGDEAAPAAHADVDTAALDLIHGVLCPDKEGDELLSCVSESGLFTETGKGDDKKTALNEDAWNKLDADKKTAILEKIKEAHPELHTSMGKIKGDDKTDPAEEASAAIIATGAALIALLL